MVSHTVSKEELVIDNNDFIYKSGSNRKNFIIFAVILLVIFAIVFVALFAVEKNKVAKLTEDAEISKQKGDASKKPMHSTKKPMHSTKKPMHSTKKPMHSTKKPMHSTKKPMHSTKKPMYSTKKPPSFSSDSVLAAAGIIGRMDPKADPCKDFYQYACGGWVEKTAIPDSKTSFSTFSQLGKTNTEVIKMEINKIASKTKNTSSLAIKNAVKYYQACMNTKMIEKRYDQPLKDFIKDYNSWPVTNSSFDSTSWDWKDTFSRFHKYLYQAPLFNMYVGDDIKNSTRNSIIFGQSGLGIQREAYLLNTSYHLKYSQAYRKLMKDVTTLLGANQTGLDIMDQVYEFEKKLANITLPVAVSRQYNTLYRKMSLKAFANDTEIPLSWLKEWLNFAFSESNYNVGDDEMVISYSKDYIRDAYKLFHQAGVNVQASYIMWNGVKSFASILLGKYKEAYTEYYQTIYGTSAEAQRWETCMGSTTSSFGFALGRLFVDTTFHSSAKTMADEMIRNIRASFISNIDTLDWMDAKTKKAAVDKANGIIENIGYPAFIKNDKELDKYYAGMVVKKDQYFENIMVRKRFLNLRNYARVGKPVDKTQWGMTPSQVNAYYSPTENKIVFPAGILQSPFYDYRAPRAVNYGGIGVVVGHEITHGFDDQGKNFNKEGNSFNWWTKSSEEGFKKNSKCLVDQYSKYSMYNKNLNGNQTLGENIADNGGSKAAFKAYRNWVKQNGEEKRLPGLDLSPEQLFFVGFAQVWCSKYRESRAIQQIETGVHSISKFRVIGTLHNSEDFSKVFKCPKGSYMNAGKKCSVW